MLKGIRVNQGRQGTWRARVRRAGMAWWTLCLLGLMAASPALAQVDLVVTTSDSPDPVVVNQQVQYTINVGNLGAGTATAVVADVFFSPTLTYVPQATPGWTCILDGGVGCSLDTGVIAGGGNAPALQLRFAAPSSPQSVQISASASSAITDINPSNNTSVQGTQVIAGTADLNLAVSGSTSSATVGSPVSFTLNVSNAGPGNATSLQVNGTLTGAFTFSSFGVSPSWSCSHSTGAIGCTYIGGAPSGTLPSGVNAAPIVVNGIAGPATGAAQLSASAISATTDPTPASASASINVTAPVVAVDLGLTKSVIGAQPIARGQPFTFRLVASNSSASTQTASGIQVTDTLPAGIALQSFSGAGWNCTGAVSCTYLPTLGIGQTSVPLDLLVVYNSAVPPGGAQVTNIAQVSAAEPDPSPSNNTASAIANLRASADLGVQWTGPSTVAPGASFNVDLSASNAGPDAGADVTVSATISSGFAIDVVNGGVGWSCLASGQSITCQRPALSAGVGSVVSLGLTAPATPGGPFVQSALISGSSFDATSSNNAASLPITVAAATAPLSLLKTDTIDPVPANAEFEYVLTVTNGGSAPQTGVVISDTMPATVRYLGFSGSGWTCSGDGGAGATVSCNLALALQPGVSSSVRLRARGESAGTVINNAQVRSAQNSVGAVATHSTTISDSLSLTLSKRARVATVAIGANAVFDLTVGNNGQSDAGEVLLVDELPAGLDPVSAAGEGWTCQTTGARIECRRPALLRGATSSVVVEARAQAAGTLTNQASVASGSLAPVPASASVTVSATPPPQVADLTLDLSDSTDPVASGAEFDYVARVRNLGPDAAAGVRVQFVLPAAVQSLGSSTQGWNCQGSECSLGAALASGAESAVTLRVRAIGSGSAIASATVGSTVTDPAQGNNSDSETTLIQGVPASADLQVSASAPATASAGGRVEVAATIRNLGPGPAAAVVLRSQLSGAWALDGGTGSGFTCSTTGVNVECRGGSLAANESVELRLQGAVSPAAVGALGAILTASSTTTDPVSTNNAANVNITATAAQGADLAITKVDSADPVIYGERFSYTLTVRNQGPAAASGIVIRDPLPSGLGFVSAAGAGLTCSGGAAVECRAAAPLASGQQLTVTVTVDAPTTAGTITNEATVEATTADPVSSNNRATQTTRVNTPEGNAATEILGSGTQGDGVAGAAVTPVVALCDGSTGQVSALCDALLGGAASGNSTDEVNQALRALYPEEVLSHHASLNQLGTQQSFNIDQRLLELRNGGGNGLSISGLSVVNGRQVIPLGLLQGLFEDEEPQIGGPGDLISPWGFFVNGSISRGDQDIDSDELDVVQDFDSVGITAGVDYRRSARWVLGGAIGYNKFESKLTDAGGLDTSGFTLTGFSAWYLNDTTYVDTRLSYGRIDLDQSRRLRINLTGFALDETLESSTSATQMQFAASVGHHISRGAWTFTPNGFIRYMRSTVDGFSESGSDFAVSYSDQTVSSTVFGAGLQVSRVISLSNGVLTPQFDLVWNQETGNDDTVIDAAYVGGNPGEFFRLRPEDPDKSYGSVGFGLVYILANGKQAYMQLRQSVGVDGLSQSTVNLGARFEF